MRPLEEWDESDLVALIANEVQEGLRLDYKQSDSLSRSDKAKAEIAKDVSAFANSAGGRLIYGIIEAKSLPVGIDAGSDSNMISREWLEQVINSRISPRLLGVVIKPIALACGGTAFVIDIPQATSTAPHQAGHRYYRRFNFESVPMEDYEVKDAFRRASIGEPYLRFQWRKSTPDEDGSPRIRLLIHGGNYSIEPILYSNVVLRIEQGLLPSSLNVPEWTVAYGASLDIGDEPLRPVTTLRRNMISPNHMPFFKEVEWLMLDLVLPLPSSGSYIMGYEFLAPGVERRVYGFFDFAGHQVTSRTPELISAGLSSHRY